MFSTLFSNFFQNTLAWLFSIFYFGIGCFFQPMPTFILTFYDVTFWAYCTLTEVCFYDVFCTKYHLSLCSTSAPRAFYGGRHANIRFVLLQLWRGLSGMCERDWKRKSSSQLLEILLVVTVDWSAPTFLCLDFITKRLKFFSWPAFRFYLWKKTWRPNSPALKLLQNRERRASQCE